MKVRKTKKVRARVHRVHPELRQRNIEMAADLTKAESDLNIVRRERDRMQSALSRRFEESTRSVLRVAIRACVDPFNLVLAEEFTPALNEHRQLFNLIVEARGDRAPAVVEVHEHIRRILKEYRQALPGDEQDSYDDE